MNKGSRSLGPNPIRSLTQPPMVVTRAVSAQGAQELELMLAERELDWALLPHTTRKGALRYLSASENLCLNNAVLNSEERPHLVAAHKDLESAGFN